MEDRFGYGAIVRAMRPEEREEMLGLLLEAVAGEMPAGAEEEPPEACPRCGCPRTVRRGRDADGAQRRLVRALAEMGVAAHERFASSDPRAPLNRVNALHSALKAFPARFRGVSTRRLPNYLAWFCWAREARRGGDAASLLRAQMGSGTYRTSWRRLWRQPYPFHPEISMS